MKTDKYIHDLPIDVVNGDIEDKAVIRALDLVRQWQETYDIKKDEFETIKDNYESGFSVEKQKGMKFCNSTLTANICKKVFERLDFLGYSIKFIGTGIEKRKLELFSQIAKSALEDVMMEAGFSKAIKQSDDSAYQKLTLYGDAFILVGKKDKLPISYQVIESDKVILPKGARQMRGSATGQDVRQIALLFDFEDYDTFVETVIPTLDPKWQKIAKKASWGDLPLEKDELELNEKAEENNTEQDRHGQMMIYIDLDMKTVVKIVGNQATIIEKFEGEKNFPYKKENGELYIPVVNLKGMISNEGYYSYGVGHYICQPHFVDNILKNKTISGVLKQVDPIQIYQGKPGGAGDFQGYLMQAEMSAAEGRHAVIYDEPDENGQYALGKVQTLSGGQISDVGQIVENLIMRDIVEFGVAPSETQTQASKTATAIMSEQENANTLVREISRRFAPEYKFLIELTIEHFRKFISKNDKTPIDTSMIEPKDEIEENFLMNVTRGRVVDFLNEYRYVVELD